MPIILFIIAVLIINRRGATRPAAVPALASATALTADAQWSKVVGIVSASIDRTAVTQRYHAAAEDQLDAAAYALSSLMDDLAAVMVLPASRSGMSVVRLQPAPAVVSARRRSAAAA